MFGKSLLGKCILAWFVLMLAAASPIASQTTSVLEDRSDAEVPDSRSAYFESLKFQELFRGFQIGLRNQLTESEIELLQSTSPSDEEFEANVSKVIEQVGDRITFRLSSGEQRATFGFHMSLIAAMNISMGNLDDGIRQANIGLAINKLSPEASDAVANKLLEAIAAVVDSPSEINSLSERDRLGVQELLKSVAGASQSNVSVEGELRPLGFGYKTAIVLARLNEFDAAIEALNKEIAQQRSDLESAESDEELQIRIRQRLSFLYKTSKNLHLAIGNAEEAGNLLAKSIELYRLNRIKAWEKAKTSSEVKLPRFQVVWTDCIETGMGPTLPVGSQPMDSEPKRVAFIFQRNSASAYFLTAEQLPKPGRELLQELSQTTYLKSEQVEEALTKFLNTPEFEDLQTITVLEFPLLECELANGKGKAAWDRFNKLQDKWGKLGQDLRYEEDFKSLSELFFVGPFDFSTYRDYLCTYFDNDEFRDLAGFSRRWKQHGFAFGFEREIPDHALAYLKNKLDKRSAQRAADLERKYQGSPKPTPAAPDKIK